MSSAVRLNSTLKYILIPLMALILLFLGAQVVWGSQQVNLIVDGVKIEPDVPAYIDHNSRTMVPVRFVTEALGSFVSWDGKEQKVVVKRGNVAVELWINEKTARVNGENKLMDTAAALKDGRTMVPLRFLAETFGMTVSWDNESRSVSLRLPVVLPPSSDKTKTVTVTGSIVNIRSGPDTSLPRVTQVKAGTVLTVIGELGEWYEVDVPGFQKGWIAGWLVDVNEAGREYSGGIGGNDGLNFSLLPFPRSALIMKDIVNVRSSPGANFPLIAQVKCGQKLAIVGEQDDWYEVSLPDGRTGWIARWLTAVVYSPHVGPSRGAGKSVVIDPGHGMTHLWDGSDPGAIGPSGVVERDVVMNISLKLGDILLKEGFTVIFTRHGDTSLTLSERANAACAANADLLVSVHANASTNPQLSGTMTFYCSSREPGQEAINQNRMVLASVIQVELVALLQREDKGVREANFLVLRESLVPAVLVETAFISNSVEEKLLASSEFQRLSAESISRGIKNFFGR
ncbi:MAG: N-acetylmuramoyl-L-alanine amidase [Bacillota bacterium]|nr:N-acetylmuramoyl-L-alanine amidase [Bacillota bacterium]